MAALMAYYTGEFACICNRRKLVQPPALGSTIKLKQPADTVYKSGDPVEGNVIITPVQKMNLDNVTVES